MTVIVAYQIHETRHCCRLPRPALCQVRAGGARLSNAQRQCPASGRLQGAIARKAASG